MQALNPSTMYYFEENITVKPTAYLRLPVSLEESLDIKGPLTTDGNPRMGMMRCLIKATIRLL